MQSQRFTVRAMPAMGFSHRWCAQRPWGKEPIDVVVVDAPAKPIERTDDEGKKRYSYGPEISAAELEELRHDPHIALSIAGSGESDPLELNAAQAKIFELEKKVVEARREAQGEVEALKASYQTSQKQYEEATAKVHLLEQQLAGFQAQLETRRTQQKR